MIEARVDQFQRLDFDVQFVFQEICGAGVGAMAVTHPQEWRCAIEQRVACALEAQVP